MKKIILAVIAFVLGFLIFIGKNQRIGAAIILLGIILVDLYNDERKQSRNKSKEN